MHNVKLTYKVLLDKLLYRDSLEVWKDWALEMMEAGHETKHLILLAGLSSDINLFQFDELVNKALKELNLDKMSNDEIFYGYAYYLIDQALNSKMSIKMVLSALRELCRAKDFDSELSNFYSLAFALEELEDVGVQYYWEGANRENIASIINAELLQWKSKYELNALVGPTQ